MPAARGKFDFLIIGAGAAAFAAAIKADQLGAHAAVVKGPLPLGGTCVNVGCVPSKFLVRAAELVRIAKANRQPGIRLALDALDYAEIIRAELDLVRSMRTKKYESVIEATRNVAIVEGTAQFLDANRVRVGSEELTGDKILIATGSSVSPPSVPGLAHSGFLTHITALSSQRLPESLLILGSGPLGLEFSQLFSRFGVNVTLVVRGSQLFSRTEPELSLRLEEQFIEEGITVLKNTHATKVRLDGDRRVVTVSTPSGDRDVVVGQILAATGKAPNTEHLSLGHAGVQTDEHRAVVTDPTLRTSTPNIFAAGDVTNLPLRLETTAGREGTFAAENALTGSKKSVDYETVPWTVFTDPQLAGVGLLDRETSKRGLACTCATLDFEHVAKAQILGETQGLSKMVADHKTGRIVGIHVLSPHAGDIISQAELILKNHMTVEQMIETVGVFPTLAEALKVNALALVTDVSKLSCCI